MIDEIDEEIERLKALAERMETLGEMADIDMALMYLRHARLRIENRRKRNE